MAQLDDNIAGKTDGSPEDIASFLKGDRTDKTDKTDKADKAKGDVKDNKLDEKAKDTDEGIDEENDEDLEDKDEDIDEDDEIEVDDEDKIDLKDEEKITAPPRRKEISKKYPEFFKEFPWFEKMMYRDRQVQERFGSFDDAMEAADKADVFDDMQSSVLSGNPEKFLTEVKTGDSKAFKKFVDNFLPTLAKVDKDAYKEVAQDVTRLLITSMVRESQSTRNEDAKKALEEAAEILNQHIFGTSEFVPKKRAESSEDSELEQEKQKFNNERLQTAVSDVTSKVTKIIKNTISENIDPKNEMTPFVKKNAIRECMEALDNSIDEDRVFKRQLTQMWSSAVKDKLPQSALDKIRSTWLGKAKGFLPVVIRKARAEALKGSVSTKRDKDDEDSRREPIRNRKISTSSQSGNAKGRKEGESAYDYLMRRD
jgi:hypothetical protein